MRGFEPDDAAQRCRIADRAAGIRAKRERTKPGCNRRSGSAARAAGDALGIPRIACGAVVGVDGGRGGGEFVRQRLPEHERPGIAETSHRFGIARRHELAEEAGAVRRSNPRGFENVFHTEWNAVQRATPLSRTDFRFGALCVFQRDVRGNGEISRKIGIQCVDPSEIRVSHLDRRELPPPDVLRKGMTFTTAPPLVGHISAGKLRPLAITGKTRLSSLRDVPTAAEAGYPQLDVTSWFALYAPAGTPKPVVDKLTGEIAAITKNAAFVQKAEEQGAQESYMTRPPRFIES